MVEDEDGEVGDGELNVTSRGAASRVCVGKGGLEGIRRWNPVNTGLFIDEEQ